LIKESHLYNYNNLCNRKRPEDVNYEKTRERFTKVDYISCQKSFIAPAIPSLKNFFNVSK